MLSPSSKPHLGPTPRALGFLRSHAEAEVVVVAVIRKDAIKRAALIDVEMGWKRGTAIGKLAMLWNTSQEDEGKSIAPRRLILEWACVEIGDEKRFLDLCCHAGADGDDDRIHFLELRGKDRYFIVGNPEAIQQIKRRRAAASTAGAASAAKRHAQPDVQRDVEHDEQRLVQRTSNKSELESELGFESESDLSGGGPPAKRPGPTHGSLVWQAYLEAYRRAYGHDPVRNAKSNALCSQLVKRLGLDDAQAVVRFYLTHRGNWYVQKVHQLEYAVKDAEALRTQMLAGHQMTASQAQEVDRNAGTAQAFAATAARLERERLERERMAGGEP